MCGSATVWCCRMEPGCSSFRFLQIESKRLVRRCSPWSWSWTICVSNAASACLCTRCEACSELNTDHCYFPLINSSVKLNISIRTLVMMDQCESSVVWCSLNLYYYTFEHRRPRLPLMWAQWMWRGCLCVCFLFCLWQSVKLFNPTVTQNHQRCV